MSLQKNQTRSIVHSGNPSTQDRIVHRRRVWIIEDFSRLITKRVVLGPEFGVSATDDIKWELRLFPQGYDELTQDFVSVLLDLNCPNECFVSVDARILILPGGDALPSDTMPIGENRRLEKGMFLEFGEVINRQFLLNNQQSYLLDNRLIVFCEVRFCGQREALDSVVSDPV